MNRNEILEKIKEIIKQYLEVQITEDITEEHLLFDDLSIDSIMVLQLIVYIEEEFNLSFPDEGVSPEVFLTMGSIISFIDQLQSAETHLKV
jgi:aryl carrier protein AsbD